MSWNDAADVAAVASAIVAAVGMIIAAGALLYAHKQIRANSAVARETTALTAYREYLRLCFDRPDYSSATLAARMIGAHQWDGVLDRLSPESERYLWMLTILLNTCEQVLAAEPTDEQWRSALGAQLSYHEGPLEQVWPSWRLHYGEALRDLVESALPGTAIREISPSDERQSTASVAHNEEAGLQSKISSGHDYLRLWWR